MKASNIYLVKRHIKRYTDKYKPCPTNIPPTLSDFQRYTYQQADENCYENLTSILQQFHLFKKLPEELRRKIFKYALPYQRNVQILQTAGIHVTLNRQEQEKYWVCQLNRPPALLFVDREARSVALENYTLAFGGAGDVKPVYFNFKIDRLYLIECSSDLLLHRPALQADFEQVCHLGFCGRINRGFHFLIESDESHVLRLLPFKELEDVYLGSRLDNPFASERNASNNWQTSKTMRQILKTIEEIFDDREKDKIEEQIKELEEAVNSNEWSETDVLALKNAEVTKYKAPRVNFRSWKQLRKDICDSKPLRGEWPY